MANTDFSLPCARSLSTSRPQSRDDGGVSYGSGRAAGDEEGFLRPIRACNWSPDTAPRLKHVHPFRIVAVYDAQHRRTGVMAGFSAYAHTPRRAPDKP